MTGEDDKTMGNLDLDAQNFAQVLRYIAKKRGHTHKSIARFTGINLRTVEGHMEGQTLPNLVHFREYLALFGAPLIDAFLEPIGFKAATIEGGVDSEIMKALEPVIRKHFPDMKYGGGE